ncbi:hypothetical protein AVEN_185492-1 [Araneus ventricosus]|uniref:Uncharacterized protein n=1 Tax=Araneus ventricosus TaxID=182803 RepID=A0A4Y2GZQ7_ARAVE|nr:hypothetical protein AVEN_185492-1 [Araneus ventricosus]
MARQSKWSDGYRDRQSKWSDGYRDRQSKWSDGYRAEYPNFYSNSDRNFTLKTVSEPLTLLQSLTGTKSFVPWRQRWNKHIRNKDIFHL